MKKIPPISLVMPMYNTAPIAEKVVTSYYRGVVAKIPGSEFVIAEDGSTDGTKEILKRLAKKYPLKLIIGDKKKGYIRAVKDAFQLPRNDIIFFSDSDGEHDPKDFWKMIKLLPNNDIIVGYKKERKGPFYRVLASRVNNFLIGLLFGLWLRDTNCGFRIIRKKVIKDVLPEVHVSRYAFAAEFTIRAYKKGYRVVECGVSNYPARSSEFSAMKMPKVFVKQLYDLMKIKIELWSK